MGNAQSVSKVEMLNSVISESLTKSVMNVSNSKQVKLDQNQVIDIECTPSDAVIMAHMRAYEKCLENAWNMKNCDGIQVACKIEKIKQSSTMDYRGMSTIDQDTVAKVQSQMTADLSNKVQEKTDDFGAALKQLLSTGSESDSSKNISNNIKSRVEQIATANLINSVNTAFSGNQTVRVRSAGSTSISQLSQESAVRLVEDILSKNTSVQDIVNQVAAKVENKTDVESKGLTNIVDSIASVIKSNFMIFIIGLVICVVVGGLVMFGLGTDETFNQTARQGIRKM